VLNRAEVLFMELCLSSYARRYKCLIGNLCIQDVTRDGWTYCEWSWQDPLYNAKILVLHMRWILDEIPRASVLVGELKSGAMMNSKSDEEEWETRMACRDTAGRKTFEAEGRYC
jgi:hypothetical protein